MALYLRRRRIYVTEEAFGCVQYFADGVNDGSSITFVRNALVALRSCLPRQGNERTEQPASPHGPFYAAVFFIARITDHVKSKYG